MSQEILDFPIFETTAVRLFHTLKRRLVSPAVPNATKWNKQRQFVVPVPTLNM